MARASEELPGAFPGAFPADVLRLAPAASAQPSCGALGGTPDATGMCRIHEVGTGYERTAAFPIDYPDRFRRA